MTHNVFNHPPIRLAPFASLRIDRTTLCNAIRVMQATGLKFAPEERDLHPLMAVSYDKIIGNEAFREAGSELIASFYQWRRKLSASLPAPNDQFVRVEVLSEQASEPPVRVQLPCGAVLEIASQQHELVLGVIDQL